ncbi:MAG TPA: 1-(5-phosphoribosyl)-5-[(5-phosphoribosylamino)methylideneamino]imidazole-4-carboxamide isomerase [Phnomibacter sp.]|nr:1-(5-phosphoribosyl)-5-[(5-phosphoribosylamino)methylideneamino]imidazole-4-carboxamide isomerase [Phnomibacter sp.]
MAFSPIPAIDIIDGKCVRLTKGDYEQKKIYNEHPLEVALQFEDAGLSRLHLVDLDGAKAGTVKNWKVLEHIAGKTGLTIDFGGGIKSVDDVHIVFNSGAAFATVGSMAVKDAPLFEMLLLKFGADRFLLGADVRDEMIAIHGWTEQTQVGIMEFLGAFLMKGVRQFFCTDIAKDGMMQGPSTDLYKKILEAEKDIQLIASGGIRHLQDVLEMKEIGMAGAIIGKAIYEGKINLKELAAIN